MPPLARTPKDLGELNFDTFAEHVRHSGNKRVLDFFRELDIDDSGEISSSEFGKAVMKMGFISATKEEVAATFAALDSDGSGKVPYKELDKRIRETRKLPKLERARRRPSAAAPAAPADGEEEEEQVVGEDDVPAPAMPMRRFHKSMPLPDVEPDEAAFRALISESGSVEELTKMLVGLGETAPKSKTPLSLEAYMASTPELGEVVDWRPSRAHSKAAQAQALLEENARLRAKAESLARRYEPLRLDLQASGLEEAHTVRLSAIAVAGGIPWLDVKVGATPAAPGTASSNLMSDPYLEFIIVHGPRQYALATAAIQNHDKGDAQWEAPIEFVLPWRTPELRMRVVLWDEDKTNKDDVIGQTEFQLTGRAGHLREHPIELAPDAVTEPKKYKTNLSFTFSRKATFVPPEDFTPFKHYRGSLNRQVSSLASGNWLNQPDAPAQQQRPMTAPGTRGR